MKILGTKTKLVVKKYVTSEKDGHKYLTTFDDKGNVRYISEMIFDDKLYSNGYSLKNLPTKSIKVVFGISKREFLEKIREREIDETIVEEIIRKECVDDCSKCRVNKWCCNSHYFEEYNVEDILKLKNIEMEMPF